MSGSRALASARRRRAGPPEPTAGQSQRNMSSSTPSYTSSPGVSSTPPSSPSTTTKMTPAQMLLSHNKIIENMQLVVSNLNDEVSKLNTNISVINNKLENLNIDENSKNYYEKQISNMNDVINETKKHILKVQTFSMETNLQCMEIKKAQHLKYDKLNENIYETSDRVVEILSKIDNSVDIIPKDTLNVKINDLSGNVVKTETQTQTETESQNKLENEEDTYITMPDGKKIKKIAF